MKYITVGREFSPEKIVHVKVIPSDPLTQIEIKDTCFLLICLMSGSLVFEIAGESVHAVGPCFLCFNETENPVLRKKYKADYCCIYFHPQYLNVNMTLGLIRSQRFPDIATNHDLFLLKPFLDGHYVVPIAESHISEIGLACERMRDELQEQRDWYWSCRGRSYFMEIIIALERMYGLIGYGESLRNTDTAPTVKDLRVREAILYLEGNYMNEITLADVSGISGLNHTTLTKLLKQHTGFTAMEYLMQYRIKVAKKHLAFTEIPIKTVALRTGFKTVQHFGRVFKSYTGTTPAAFRKATVQKRKDELSTGE